MTADLKVWTAMESSISITLGKGYAIAGIQFATGIGILAVITGTVLLIAS